MKRSTRTKKSLLCGTLSWPVVWCVLVSSLPSTAQPYVEIFAEIKLAICDGHDPTGAADANQRTISLTCVTGTNEWRIESDYIQGGNSAWYFDGTTVYQRLRATGSPAATISTWDSQDGHPLGTLSENIPWLAFCSGGFLKREGRLIPLPVEDLRHTPDRYAYTDKTTIFSDELGLPRTVDLFTSKSLFRASYTEFYKERTDEDRFAKWMQQRLAELPEGVLTFHYAVTESTNFFGHNFPTEFEFFQKGRKYEQNGDWFSRGVGRVKSIRPTTKPEGFLTQGAEQTIVDWRLSDTTDHVDGVVYRSTNASLSPTTDPALQKALATQVEQARRARMPKEKLNAEH